MDLEMKNINALRVLAVDMIENAKSGHPGIALGAAPILYSLYSKHLNVIPDDDKNILRDRFVLSAGHGSSIYYAMLHAFGYKITIDDLKNFRKIDSKTPGHPEFNLTPGVDASTGPLGQGVAMAVGMAIAERLMASRFNKTDINLFDNYTYTLCGEGCLMEGVSYEALALAGSLKLNKLIVLYDCNNITLDGNTTNVMNQNILSYMQSLNFNTIEVEDGNDISQINSAISLAKTCKDKPSFIKINTHIGYGSVLQDNHKSHGSVLGAENVKLLKEKLNVNSLPFELDKDVIRDLTFVKKRFETVKKQLKEKLNMYATDYPGDFKVLKSYLNGIDVDYDKIFKEISLDKEMSGREIGNVVLNEIAKYIPNLVCGTADLSSSTKVVIGNGFVNDDYSKKNIKYGIREFAMGAISNGISLYGGIIPIDSTFLVFSDYMKASLRLRALMGLKNISVFTHDSIAVGEDGPTHQPCEQIWALRNIPNSLTFRPANLAEIFASYQLAVTENLPSNIILSRQKLYNFNSSINDAKKGGYILSKEEKLKIDAIILSTGTEVKLALDVKEKLKTKGYNIRVVSMPCLELFDKQSDKYKENIIPSEIKSVFVIEAGHTGGWYKYTGKFGKCFCVDNFGASGESSLVYAKFDLTVEDISKSIIKKIKENA